MSVYDTREIGKVKIVMLAGSGGGGASALTDLSDVDISYPYDGESLIYDGNNQKWVNGNAYTAGSGIILNNKQFRNAFRNARLGKIDTISSGYAHTEIDMQTNESVGSGSVVILKSEASGTANTLRIQKSSTPSDVSDRPFYEWDGTTATSVNITAGDLLIVTFDMTTGYRAQVLGVISENGGGGGDAYALAGMGKEVSYSAQTITTDIELFRAPKVGDRFLIYFPDSCSNPRSLVINVNGTPTTLSWEIVGGDTYKGLCAIEVKAGMISALALKKVWQEDELSAGTGISIVNNTITNTMPQLGENVGDRTYTTAITDGDLGNVPLSDDYIILNFKASAQPDSTTGKYTIMEAASSYHLYAALVDMAGNDYTAEIPAGTTLICKNKDGGDGTSADPYKITVLGIGSGGGGGGDTSIVRYNIVTSSTGGQDASITVNKYVNNVLKSATLYLYSDLENTVTIDDLFTLNYGNAYLSYTYTLLTASTTHSSGYAYSWAYNQTVDFEDTFVVETIIPINRGGTGNADGYIRTGAASGSTIGNYATAEGYNTTASGNYSHAQNQNTTASGTGSNATGGFTTASNSYSTAMGYQTTASGERSVAEGTYTGATGKNAHAQGSSTSAIAENSFTCGEATQAGYKNQFVVGKLNNNKSTNIFEVGNGYAESSGGSYTPHPSNAFEVDASGNVTAGGNITDGSGNKLSEAIQWDAAKTSVKKNLMPPFTTTSMSNVTFTVASDGTVSLSGTANATAFCEISNLNMTFDVPMLLTGCPSGGAAGTYRLDINNGANDYFDIGDGFILPANVTISNIRIRIGSGVNTSGMVFKPMLRYASIADDTYVPYILDNVELASRKIDTSVVGPVESGTTASQAYAVGEHFIRNDKFCTCIAAIASGATLTLNTNYVEGTIAENITKRVNYSTTEHVVGTWIDGSTVYEKTIDFGGMPAGTTKSVNAGLPSGAKVINIFGFTADSSWAGVFPLPFADATTGANYNFQLWYSNGNVSVKTTTDQRHMTIGYVTLQYIKNS